VPLLEANRFPNKSPPPPAVDAVVVGAVEGEACGGWPKKRRWGAELGAVIEIGGVPANPNWYCGITQHATTQHSKKEEKGESWSVRLFSSLKDLAASAATSLI
jgi:hypothetical protein